MTRARNFAPGLLSRELPPIRVSPDLEQRSAHSVSIIVMPVHLLSCVARAFAGKDAHGP